MYIKHLHQIFTILNSLQFKINSIKIHFKYPSLILLKQKVNTYNIIINKEKIKVITALYFFITLKKLKMYLKFTG